MYPHIDDFSIANLNDLCTRLEPSSSTLADRTGSQQGGACFVSGTGVNVPAGIYKSASEALIHHATPDCKNFSESRPAATSIGQIFSDVDITLPPASIALVISFYNESDLLRIFIRLSAACSSRDQLHHQLAELREKLEP